jgi:hypothetical protein
LRIEEESDAARCSRLPVDQTRAVKRKDHLVNRRWSYLEVALEIGLRGRTAMEDGISVDKSQILALLFSKAGV